VDDLLHDPAFNGELSGDLYPDRRCQLQHRHHLSERDCELGDSHGGLIYKLEGKLSRVGRLVAELRLRGSFSQLDAE
jgi:hypothetical protein